MAKPKRKSPLEEEVNWGEYFLKIQLVCPWSLAAWRRGLIEITDWRQGIKPLGDLHARVYLIDLKPKAVKTIADALDQIDPDCEWLWSHPKGGGPYSAPRPCMIQQDRKWLRELREKINNKSNWLAQVGVTHTPKKEAL